MRQHQAAPTSDSERRVLTPEDVAAIADAVPGVVPDHGWLGALLGLRWGEVVALTVDRLDLLKGTITVSHQMTRDGQLALPKSRAGVRRLTIPAQLVDRLAKHLAASGLTCQDRGILLFRASSSEPLHYSNWRRRVWVPAVRAAGPEGVSFHDLRRASASEMVALGIDVKTAQNRLGHSSVRMTLDVYAKALPKADRAAAEQPGERFFGIARQEDARDDTKVQNG